MSSLFGIKFETKKPPFPLPRARKGIGLEQEKVGSVEKKGKVVLLLGLNI
jgi:hypothetical protein